MTSNIHPVMQAALAPFAPKPCPHRMWRPIGGGDRKCEDCGVIHQSNSMEKHGDYYRHI